jgi:uncharacterized protein
MSGLSRHLKQLEDELLALGDETMLLDELDGFIAGLLVSPDLITPGDWLPIVWNRDGTDEQPAFEDLGHVNRVLGLVMEHYNSVAGTLMERPDRYRPLFSVDTHNGDVLWELWIDGFEAAVELRPDAWQKFLNADGDAAAAMRGMRALAEAARRDLHLPGEELESINATAPDDIARWVVALNARRLANYQPMQDIDSWMPSAPPKKVGRNDPCPCGSGKKYKKCCGIN